MTFERWRSRDFFKSDLADPPQIFDAHLSEKNNLGPSEHKTLENFVLTNKCEKMVNLKSNYGANKVEKALQNFCTLIGR